MCPYPFFNFIFWFFVILLLLFRISTYNSDIEKSVGGYILRHPYHQDGFQIVAIGNYQFKTLIYPKYYLGEYISTDINPLKSKKLNYFPKVAKIDSMTITAMVFVSSFRDFMIQRVKSTLPQPYSGLLLGFTIGLEQDYPENLEKMLISTGVIHLVVFSGSNVTFITDLSNPLLYRLRKLAYFIISACIMVLIILFVGFEPPVLRAVITALFQSIAKIFGHATSSMVTLFYSGTIMLLVNPSYLYQLSFQLSFISSIVLAIVSDFTYFIENKILKSIASNVLMVLFLYPAVSYYFDSFSFKSLFSNVLVSFVIPIILICGFLYILLPNIILGFILIVFIDYFITVLKIFNRFDALNLEISLSLNGVFIIYILLLLFYLMWCLKIRPILLSYV